MSPSLRVVVQTGSNDLDNLGDLSMLEVLIERIRERSEGVRFAVFARDQARVRSLGADVSQIPVEQKREWAALRSSYLSLRRAMPDIDRGLRAYLPSLHTSLLRMKARALVNEQAMRDADALLVSGGGFITDVFPGQAWPVLERLDAAHKAGIPFALMGQGMGPLNDKGLTAKAREVLPHAKLIAVRESVYSVPLLVSLGVPLERIVVTGDDGIEPAYRARGQNIGDALGVNFRVAEYAGATSADAQLLYQPLTSIASKLSARIVSLPVSIADSADTASDARVVSRMLNEREPADAVGVPSTTSELIQRFAQCRIVVTGSYHVAVFAMAQGIPAVCMSGSEYYEAKFRGLANQFGGGCEIVERANERFDVTLAEAIERMWAQAGSLRSSLLHAAARQIAEGHQAYDRLGTLLTGHQPSRLATGVVA